jgi:hypothetical protein
MKTASKVFVGVFVAAVVMCLCAAAFCGAWWQLYPAGVCAMMALVFWGDVQNENKKQLNSKP